MPIIAKIKRKMLVTSIIFNNAGIELKIDSTTNLSPSFLRITRKGLNALSALIAFMDFRAEPPNKFKNMKLLSSENKSTKADITTKKSRTFQASAK